MDESVVLGIGSLAGLLCGLERGSEEDRSGTYFQLYLLGAVGHAGRFHVYIGRKTKSLCNCGIGLHLVRGVLGRKETLSLPVLRLTSLGKSLPQNRDFLLDGEKYLPIFVLE